MAGFFEKQNPITALKTKIYEKYIGGYLPKLLMQFGQCIMFDLFCGPGRNGSEKGSPLILMDQIKYILSAPQLQKRGEFRVDVLFNDQKKSFIDNLEKEIETVEYDRSIIHVNLSNKNCENLLPQLLNRYECTKIPKFFFLDPFTYSNINMQNLKALINLPYTEVLLFIPLFHTYRFVSASADFSEQHKTRAFIEEFTLNGISDYRDTLDYLISIKERLKMELSTKTKEPYVREILLDAGSKKNALFLITRHQKGMLLMNKIVLGLTDHGNVIDVKSLNQMDLFSSTKLTDKYQVFVQKTEDLIKQKADTGILNNELCDFVIREGYLPKHAKDIVKNLVDAGYVTVCSDQREPLKSSRYWNIAEDIKKTTVILWRKTNEAK